MIHEAVRELMKDCRKVVAIRNQQEFDAFIAAIREVDASVLSRWSYTQHERNRAYRIDENCRLKRGAVDFYEEEGYVIWHFHEILDYAIAAEIEIEESDSDISELFCCKIGL